MSGATVRSSTSERDDRPDVEVRRSRRRRRTVAAYREDDRVVVLIPAAFTRAEENEWVERMVDKLVARERRARPRDDELTNRAHDLVRRYLSDSVGRSRTPLSVRWVTNQGGRWGSCTPVDRSIRLSSRLQGMPAWVIDYVLLHELAHLVVPGHGPDFWRLLESYPKTERARGYLEGIAAAAGLSMSDT